MQSEDPEESLGQLLEKNGQLVEDNNRLRAELERAGRERDRLKQDLEQAVTTVQGARQELQDFVYAASHDLKEPLRSISSYTQLLQRHGSDPEQMAEYTRFVLEGVAVASKLLEQLLRLSRAGSNPKRNSVNLSVPLQSALYRLQEQTKAVRAEVLCPALPEFSVDESQFTQVLEHLIDNSLKYRGSTPPRIQISCEETDEGLLLRVEDNGVGIAPEFRTQVFAPFKRLHGREIPGSGLGLAISRKIVEAHEGRIWVDDSASGGSRVNILLPY